LKLFIINIYMLNYLYFNKNQLLFYLFLTLLIYIICTYIYIKLKYRFWTCQYIYNKYSFLNKYYKNKTINNDKLNKNKFTNTFDITFINSNNIDDNTYQDIFDLLKYTGLAVISIHIYLAFDKYKKYY